MAQANALTAPNTFGKRCDLGDLDFLSPRKTPLAVKCSAPHVMGNIKNKTASASRFTGRRSPPFGSSKLRSQRGLSRNNSLFRLLHVLQARRRNHGYRSKRNWVPYWQR